MALLKFSQVSIALAAIMSSSALLADALYSDRSSIEQKLSDQDNDGVVNVRDFCPDTPLNALVDNDGCANETKVVQSIELEILFDVNSATVKPKFYPEIKQVADFLQDHPSTTVVIQGHTDNTGSNALNRALSNDRAEAIALTLTRQFGIAQARVDSKGFGETSPIASNDTEAGRRQNRRVVAEISAKKTVDEKRWREYEAEQ